MKPHQLSIEAFGPYADPVTIDFDALAAEGLFLIHGTTGAGKTFLLDALCFALYGEVSGDRSVKGLRSDHAAPGAVPRVSLAFSCGEARYRVERSPAHTAAKARGHGFVDKPPQALLMRLAANGAEQPVAAKTTEVSREVEQLVGLNAAQFRQVILLPQGRFAEVLRAKADDREALLKTLFDTVLYERAGWWLDDQAKAARLAVQQQHDAQAVLRDQAGHAWLPYAEAAEHAEAAGSAALVEGQGPGGLAAPADQAGLDALVERIAAVVEASAAARHQAGEALEAARATRSQHEALAERFDRRATAAAQLAELEAKQPLVLDFRQRLARAERAEALRPSLAAELEAQQALAQLEQEIRSGLLHARRTQAQAPALPSAVQALDLAVLPSPEALGSAGADLAARAAEVRELAKKAQEATGASQAAAAASQRAAAAEAQATEASARLQQLQVLQQQELAALAEARTAHDQLDGLQRAAREATAQAAAAAAIAPAQTRQLEAVAARNAADQRLNAQNAALNALRRRQIEGMAARLAAGLEAGGPCPVCGSTAHPQPALPSADAVSDGEIQAVEQQLVAANTAVRAAGVAMAQAEAALQSVLEKAGAGSDVAAAALAASAASGALAAASAQAARRAALEQGTKAREQQGQALQQAIEAARTATALERRAQQEASGRAAELVAAVAQELGAGLDPAAVLAAFAPLESALRNLIAAAASHARAVARQEQAAQRLAGELAASPFGSASEASAALIDAAKRQQWALRIEAYDKQVIELQGALAAPDLADVPEQRPDTAAALAAETHADQLRTTAVERHSEARGAQAEIQRLTALHRERAAGLARQRAKAELLSAVANRCQGKAAPYISLQRWVLSAYLADICSFANQRLTLMTSGRYQLRLTDEGGHGGRHAGLGLRVLDAYTGEEREVSSLSGGETFQASLALALGVADTVQAHAGGVPLEALFIDEGFGSLDPDNLQLAMDELDRLRAGGRMIGLISHVGALRERIRGGIEVIAGDRGSTLRQTSA
ncbi:SMC family ATPase [Synechococcus sp. ATX 2A4]|uniref:AAA family ATPase n=1 Tax=Synechococcus sp. ATX 2A4 TaxID=2823727 RepID=UPI0020CF8A33|nr:SMC family ATPase [Synechococcus sp. ATX 2A4]MCP9883536.1 SMC family ATPase [Synechococcus sp. ATX 2A4]